MSMICCSECSDFIDSDQDPECFYENHKGEEVILCASCREEEESFQRFRDEERHEARQKGEW